MLREPDRYPFQVDLGIVAGCGRFLGAACNVGHISVVVDGGLRSHAGLSTISVANLSLRVFVSTLIRRSSHKLRSSWTTEVLSTRSQVKSFKTLSDVAKPFLGDVWSQLVVLRCKCLVVWDC